MIRDIRYFKAKYSNKTGKCLAGHYHQSIAEADYCNILFAKAQAGEISSYTCQVPYELVVNGIKICSHVVDFVVHADGKEEVHEVKGFPTEVWQLKYKLFKALFPGTPYLIITKDYRYGARNKYPSKRRRRPY